MDLVLVRYDVTISIFNPINFIIQVFEYVFLP